MAKRINFFDGAQSGTVPTIGNITTTDLVTYANDAAFEAANVGSPVAGNIYFNTTLNLIRYYNGSSWGSIVDESSTQTVTNKAIDGSNNTISNLDGDEVIIDAIPGLTATDAQAAFTEHQTEIEQNTTDIATNVTNISNNASDISDLQTDKEDKANKGIANGYASLDSGGKVPVTQLPSSLMEYKGTWDASTNTPTLADGIGDNGDIYVASPGGTQNLGSGNITFATGDWVIYNGSVWQKSINSDAVQSVNSFTGAVTLDTDDIPEGTNKYNATHTGEVTGSTVLTVDKTTITNKTIGTPESGDFFLFSDTSDSGNMKAADFSSLSGGGSGGSPKLVGGGTVSMSMTQIITEQLVSDTSDPAPAMRWEGGTFTPSQTFTANTVAMDLRNATATTGDYEMLLYNTAAGQPSGAPIATTGPIAITTLPGINGTLIEKPLVSPVLLNSGVTYAIIVHNIDGDGDVRWMKTVSDLGGGDLMGSNDGTSWTTTAGRQAVYQIKSDDLIAIGFTSPLFLEVAGLDYVDNRIPITESPIIFGTTDEVAYVTPNNSSPGPDLSVDVGTLDGVPPGSAIIARVDGADVLVGDTDRYEDGAASRLYSGSETDLVEAQGQPFTYPAFVAGVWLDITSFELPPGTWDVHVIAVHRIGSATLPGAASDLYTHIHTVPGNAVGTTVYGSNTGVSPYNNLILQNMPTSFRSEITVSSPTTYYLKHGTDISPAANSVRLDYYKVFARKVK